MNWARVPAPSDTDRCLRRAALLAMALCFAPVLSAQDPEPVVEDPLPAARTAVQKWLGSALDDRTLLEDAVAKVLAAGKPGLRVVADADRTAPADDRRGRIAVDSLISSVATGFLQEATNSGLVYAGQYDDLAVLQPGIGRYLTGLVLDTPDWFPDNMRPLVVPALRDLYPKGPEEAVVRAFAEICEDTDFESQALREAVSYALAQWGRREFVQDQLDEYTENAGEGQTADELHFVRALAGIHYNLREYERSADLWTRFLQGTLALGGEPSAHEEYNAACNLALAGRREAALAAMERCAARIAEGKMQSTAPLTRSMFETDPDLRSIRPDPRYSAATEQAFPGAEDQGKGDDGQEHADPERRR